LKRLNDDRLSSISFPSIGGGGLGFPSDIVANKLLNAACSFLDRNRSKSFTINFVIYDKDHALIKVICFKIKMKRSVKVIKFSY
jgi:O-acetyl-ADP-ribose deacetylase (regulator of RNase III)